MSLNPYPSFMATNALYQTREIAHPYFHRSALTGSLNQVNLMPKALLLIATSTPGCSFSTRQHSRSQERGKRRFKGRWSNIRKRETVPSTRLVKNSKKNYYLFCDFIKTNSRSELIFLSEVIKQCE